MSKKKKLFCFLVILSFVKLSNIFSFSKENILSPISGQWSNLQALFINNPDSCEIYYSFTDSDPLISGFSYDGPIIIDKTGQVDLSIAVIDEDGKRQDFKINYIVNKMYPYENDTEEYYFVYNILQNPIVKFISGSTVVLPSTFKVSFDNELLPYMSSVSINNSKHNSLERYIPCTISDENNNFHFIIHTIPAENEESFSYAISQRIVPFEIENWTDFYFTGNNLIYQIDDEYWNISKEKIVLDRTKEHIVRWQSIDFKEGNPVSHVVLPIKPELSSLRNEDGSMSFFLNDDSKFNLSSSKKLSLLGNIENKFYNKVIIDIFDGDCINDNFNFAVYYENVYQGDLNFSLNLDKKPPISPKIISSVDSSYTRKKVKISFNQETENKIFYSISEPYECKNLTKKLDDEEYNLVSVSEYLQYNNEEIILESKNKNSTFYKIMAYSLDSNNNKSEYLEYRVIVDEYNYYFMPSKQNPDLKQDLGTYENPFTEFKQVIKQINKNDFTKLNILEDVLIKNDTYEISSDCLINSFNNNIVFDKDAILKINDSKVLIINSVIEKKLNTKDSANFIFLNKSDFELNSSELVGKFKQNGILIDAKLSEIKINNSGLTVQGNTYSCIISANNSKIYCNDSRLTSIAPSCVNISLNGGFVDLNQNMFTVIGNMARNLEFFSSNINISNNQFIGNFPNDDNNRLSLWKDVESMILLDEGNLYKGF